MKHKEHVNEHVLKGYAKMNFIEGGSLSGGSCRSQALVNLLFLHNVTGWVLQMFFRLTLG